MAALAGIPRALRLVWDTQPLLTVLLGAITLFQALVPAATAWVGKLVVDGVVGAMANPAEGLRPLLPLVGLALGIALGGQLLNSVAQLLQELLRDLLGRRINLLIIEKAITLDLSYYENPEFYDMLQRAQQEAGHRPLAMLQQIFSLGRGLLTLASFVILLVSFSPWLVLAVIGTGLPAFFVQSAYGRANFTLQSQRALAWRRLIYLGFLLTDQSFAKEIKLFGLAPTLLKRYKQLYQRFYEENRGLAVKRAVGNALLQGVALLAYFGGYVAVMVRTIAGYLTLGDLTLYSAILMQAQSTVNTIMFGLADLYEQNLFITNLFAFLSLEPHIPSNGSGKLAPETLRSGIDLQNVTFQYPGAARPVLREINLKIAPGEKVALVGENGAGKTTLIKLLARLYDPSEGKITLDGVDLREVNVASLHSRVGVIFQDFVRYPFSGRENIGFGQIEALEDEPRIEAAARKSGAHEVLAGLPQGYDTILGRRFDDQGPDLSYGQWQKIALARAYVRNAPLLILDEPTASLDAKAEYEVFKHFKELAADRTVILISHRFSTVRMADRIVVLEEGRIVEQGTHDALMNAGGLYAAMFNMQAEGYR